MSVLFPQQELISSLRLALLQGHSDPTPSTRLTQPQCWVSAGQRMLRREATPMSSKLFKRKAAKKSIFIEHTCLSSIMD